MSNAKIVAEKRDTFGTRSVRRMRREGQVPGVIYAGGEEAIHLSFEVKEVSRFLNHAHGLVDLEISGEKTPHKCILKDVQYNPITDVPMHVDFLGVTLGTKLQMTVSLNLVGSSAGVKLGGTLDQVLRELNIECLPKDIPDSLDVDVTELNIGDGIHVSDLSFEKVEILNDPSDTVVQVIAPRLVDVDDEIAEEAEEVVDEESEGEEGEEG